MKLIQNLIVLMFVCFIVMSITGCSEDTRHITVYEDKLVYVDQFECKAKWHRTKICEYTLPENATLIDLEFISGMNCEDKVEIDYSTVYVYDNCKGLFRITYEVEE